MLAFQWHVTDRCHGLCAHCYGEKFDKTGEFSLSEAETALNRLSEAVPAGSSLCPTLTGGEPFLLPHFNDLLGLMDKYASISQYSIISSGADLNTSLADRLADSPKLSDVKISCEAASAAANDLIRWEGSFEAVLQSSRMLSERNIPVHLMTTVSSVNYREIPELIELIHSKKLYGLIVERFVPVQGSHSLLQPPEPSEWLYVAYDLLHYADIMLPAHSLAPFRAFWLLCNPVKSSSKPRLDGAYCNLGMNSMALVPGGDIFPCRRLPITAGNIFRDKCPDIFRKLKTYRSSNIKHRLADGMCRHCPESRCSGCRAMARAINGDYLADDPGCLKCL